MCGWRKANWTTSPNKLEYGRQVEITSSGVYLIYAQVGYYTEAPLSGFKAVLFDPRTNEHSVLTQCMIGVDYINASLSNEHHQKMRTCFTATVASLRRGERIQLQDISMDGASEYLDDISTNFFGVIQLQTPTTDRRS